MTDLTNKQLTEKLESLTAIVEKQSALITKTGQQLIEIQVKNVKGKLNEPSNNKQDLSDYVLNEDIVQLVGELQGQLDFLEDRTIARLFNSKLTKETPTKEIAPISNKDGETPDLEIYPKTVPDFLKLDKFSIVRLCEFYELILPNEETLEKFLNDDKLKTLEEANKLLTNDLKIRVEQFSEQEIKDLQDELARFLGLIFRNNENNW